MNKIGRASAHLVRRFLGGQEKLWPDDIPKAISNKNHGAAHTLFGEAGYIGRDDTQGDWEVNCVRDAQGNAHHTSGFVMFIQLPNKGHADYGDHRDGEHSQDSRPRDVGRHKAYENQEENL